MMVEDLSPTRFPIHFVNEVGDMYFSDWNWNDFFVSKELLVLESIPSAKFVDEYDRGKFFNIDKSFFESEKQYIYFIILRLLLGSNIENIFSLSQSVEVAHLCLFNPEDYKQNNIIKEMDKPVGNWKKYDLPSYRKIKESLELLNIDKKTKSIHFVVGDNISEAIGLELTFNKEILGHFVIKEIGEAIE